MDIASNDYLELSDILGPELLECLYGETTPTETPPPPCSSSHAPIPTPSHAVPAPPPNSRFGKPLLDEELQSAIVRRVPKNMQKATSWGMSVWNSWCKARNVTTDIVAMSSATLNEFMGRFVQEARKKNGGEYIPSTLLQLVAAVQCYLNDNGRPEVLFFRRRTPHSLY